MVFLNLLVVLFILFLFYAQFEARWVEVKHVRFTEAENCLKILQLSDIHIAYLRVSPQKIRQIISREKPDLIIMTGDYVARSKEAPAFLRFLDIVIENHCTVACLGNHEYKAFLYHPEGLKQFISQMENAGASILQNATMVFEKNARKYNIIGINDLRYRNHDIKEACKDLDPEAYANIAFSHNPDIIFELPQEKIDYLFCGHFHGGQIWAPFNIEFRIMRKEKLCKMGLRQGLHELRGIKLYINRGLGNVFVPLRFLSRPEITVFYIP